ncbi:hypothetical protein LEP1GSC050_0027 [Leptospira phage vB_LbrZ_5399-LE1]|uniref:Uncharacterized protein n=1 Tax=Leptospira inadai serovar Lyme TaxID=293084 RepID=A0ABX4YGC4_9LEPT|nr:hypothetical protein LEP1GSC050_0027 [Leptospira phage vB_LbrZ_5399-LE1]AGS80854.1 hypothetical protein LEP1GSC047_0844 [Leptospira phage vB_LinZ_10-LE1]PNV74293.1 hypothetical protein BES34_013990 [Leptospira inadai serovar Lyme]
MDKRLEKRIKKRRKAEIEKMNSVKVIPASPRNLMYWEYERRLKIKRLNEISNFAARFFLVSSIFFLGSFFISELKENPLSKLLVRISLFLSVVFSFIAFRPKKVECDSLPDSIENAIIYISEYKLRFALLSAGFLFFGVTILFISSSFI